VAVVFLRRLVILVGVAAGGVVVALLLDWHALPGTTDNLTATLPGTTGYMAVATVLLAIGLFSVTHEISRADLRGALGLVVNAVTFGVVLKALLVSFIMYAWFREKKPEYLVLGVVVAQIDPLAVAVMRHRSRLSSQARAILSAWSSFDDPVTAILAVYLSTVAVRLSPSDRDDRDLISIIGGYSNFWLNLLFNLLLAVAAFTLWHLLRALARRGGGDDTKPYTWSLWLRALAVAVLLIIGVVGVKWFLMLGIAFVGLFFRPGIDAALRWITPAALVVALFMLGLVLAGSVNVLPAVVLGVSAFVAQMLVGGLIVTRSLRNMRDRIRLAFSQQNGITAIILALLLETVFPGFVAIVGPAILVIGVLYLVSNALLDWFEDSRSRSDRVEDSMPQPDRIEDSRPRSDRVEDSRPRSGRVEDSMPRSTREESNNRLTDVDGKGLEFHPEGS
jgi:NhaP-type Na+/H+ or K+/H+ antiporter